MIVIALIALIFNIVLTLRLVRDVFGSGNQIEKISSFIASLMTIANCTLSIYVLRL